MAGDDERDWRWEPADEREVRRAVSAVPIGTRAGVTGSVSDSLSVYRNGRPHISFSQHLERSALRRLCRVIRQRHHIA